MTDAALLAAREAREDVLLFERIDANLDILLSTADVTPEDRRKLRGILAKYAKSPHPFRACVRDNMKRFGPGRTEKICATIKDILRGTTKWRDGGSVHASDTEIDEGLEALILSIPEEKFTEFIWRVTDE